MRLNIKATWGQPQPGWAGVRHQLASPSEHVSLERPASVARRMARVQAGVSVLVSTVIVLIGLFGIALPDEDRLPFLLLLALMAVAGVAMVAMTDRWIGRSLDVLVQSGSKLRQSAAERAADLARLNAELRRRDHERAELFATMSHELRTPLNAIIGHSRLLLDDLDGELNDEQRADVHQIHDGGLGLLRIVNGALDFARLEASAATFERVPVQVWAVAEEVVALLRPLAEVKELDLASTIGPGVPPVLADEERLRQILVNLVGNALKFTPSGLVRLRAESAAESVTIMVQDTGIGVSPQARDRIFEPFRQGEQGSARSHDGTGLGLAITRRLVELMGGRIWVESESGAGSTFFVSLPRAEEPSAVRDSWMDVAPPSEPLDVALVGGGPAAAQLVSALADRGIAALHFSGPDWEYRVAAASPRLLLVDAQQPRAGAWRMLRVASAHPSLSSLRLGLVGAVQQGASHLGNAMVLSNLSVVPFEGLSSALPGRLSNSVTASQAPVLVVGADAGWRRRVATLVQAHGLRVHESGYGDAALAVARRVPMQAVVVDLVVGGPGVTELLAELQAAFGRRECPIFVVAPDELSPHEQRDLHLGALSWLAADACPLPSLAREIAEQLAARKPALVAVGGR